MGSNKCFCEKMISVVIPIFNSARYLKKCINSVLKQDYDDLEIILINDASTDGSLKICQKYEQIDSRIKLLNKERNEGVEKARIGGLNIAQGEYLFYLDSDDWLENSRILGLLYQQAVKTDADYVEIGARKVLDRYGLISVNLDYYPTGIIEQPELFEKHYISFFRVDKLSFMCWGKLYKMSVLRQANIKSFGYIYQEDLIFNLQLFPFLKKILILKETGYCYRWGGMTKKYNPRIYNDMKSQYLLKENILRNGNHLEFMPFLNNWLINVINEELVQKMKNENCKKEDIVNYLKSEMDKTWYNVLINSSVKGEINSFYQALINKDFESVYKYCFDNLKTNYYRIRLITILEKIINKI